MAKNAMNKGAWPRRLPQIGAWVICLASACQQPTQSPAPLPPKRPTVRDLDVPPNPRPPIASAKKETGRWLYAERFAAGTKDGFVEGDFSDQRNRVTINTHAVTRFALDTRFIAIDWDKLVVIRINGHNSELKRRDDPILHFVLDRYNQWVVEE